MNNTAVILTTYNRPEHTKKTLKALVNNAKFDEFDMYIFQDGSKEPEDSDWMLTQEVVSEYAEKYKNISVKTSSKNKGLANSIIGAVSDILKKYEKVIVLEDDIVPAENFLKYMSEALEFYQEDKRIGSISAYTHPSTIMPIPEEYGKEVYFSLRPSSWGWATWQDRWEAVDWDVSDYYKFKYNPFKRYMFNRGGGDLSRMLDAQRKGKINSWAIRWAYHHFKYGLLAVYPVKPFVENIGHDGSGIHCKESDSERYENVDINKIVKVNFTEYVGTSEEILRLFRKVYSHDFKYYIRKIKLKLGIK